MLRLCFMVFNVFISSLPFCPSWAMTYNNYFIAGDQARSTKTSIGISAYERISQGSTEPRQLVIQPSTSDPARPPRPIQNEISNLQAPHALRFPIALVNFCSGSISSDNKSCTFDCSELKTQQDHSHPVVLVDSDIVIVDVDVETPGLEAHPDPDVRDLDQGAQGTVVVLVRYQSLRYPWSAAWCFVPRPSVTARFNAFPNNAYLCAFIQSTLFGQTKFCRILLARADIFEVQI